MSYNIGSQIALRYTVRKIIESGGMGVLYQVEDTVSDRVVALKTLRTASAESAALFQQEFRTMTLFRHPNLVMVHHFGVTDQGELYLTLEWLEGQELGPELFSTPQETFPVIVEILRALSYLHSRQVIHGDLKPRNILLVEGQAKLIDFGISYRLRPGESRSKYYSPGYTAPEVIQGELSGPLEDIYATGALWASLLLGEPLSPMPGMTTLLADIQLEEVLPPGMDRLRRLIVEMIAENPNERPRSAGEVIERINQTTNSSYSLETERTAASYALRAEFVGREEEMVHLQERWTRAQVGGGGLILVGGESGVGKSRLIEELSFQVQLGEGHVRVGQCLQTGGDAYRPWKDVLQTAVLSIEVQNPGLVREVGPILGEIMPGLWERPYMAALPPPAELEAQEARHRLNRAILQVLVEAGHGCPTLVVIEDGQWADEASLSVLSLLLRVGLPAPVLVCVTYRSDDVDVDHPLSAPDADRILLKRLLDSQATELIKSMLGLAFVPPLLLERLQEAGQGNTFFIQELVRSLAGEGRVLHRTIAGWQVDLIALQRARIPGSIQSVVSKRLEQLPFVAQAILRRAAVVGMVFWDGALEALGVEHPELVSGIHFLLDQELILRRGETSLGPEYLFAKTSIQETAYSEVSSEERGTLHERVSDWLIANAGPDEWLGLIANHLEGSGRLDQARLYYQKAGNQAVDQYAHTEAVRYISLALDLTPIHNLESRSFLFLSREKVLGMQGNREQQKQDLDALDGLAEHIGPSMQMEVALRRAIWSLDVGDLEQAVGMAQTAVGIAQAIQEPAKEAEAYTHWGRALFQQGRYDEAIESLQQGVATALTAGVRRIAIESQISLVPVLWLSGNAEPAQIEEIARQAIENACEEGWPAGESRAILNLALVYIYQSDPRGEALVREAIRIDRAIGYRTAECRAMIALGNYYSAIGHDFRAGQVYEQALALAREVGAQMNETVLLCNLAVVADQHGLYEQAIVRSEESLRLSRTLDDPVGICAGLTNMAMVRLHQGEPEECERYARESLALAEGLGDQQQIAFALGYLGYSLEAQGRLDEAKTLYKRRRGLLSQLGMSAHEMDSLAGLARIALAEDRVDEALKYVEEIFELAGGIPTVGTGDLFYILETCNRVLTAREDPRGEAVLATAYQLLQEKVAVIDDEAIRRSFLDNVAVNRQLIQLVESRGG